MALPLPDFISEEKEREFWLDATNSTTDYFDESDQVDNPFPNLKKSRDWGEIIAFIVLLIMFFVFLTLPVVLGITY